MSTSHLVDYETPLMSKAASEKEHHAMSKLEESPAYDAIRKAGLLEFRYRIASLDDLEFRKANSNKMKNLWTRLGFYARYGIFGGVCYYDAYYKEYVVPASSVIRLRDRDGGYFFAGPGVHLIQDFYVEREGKAMSIISEPHIQHGDLGILTVEQGFVGLAFDNGQPVLLPPGLHQWKSDTLKFRRMIDLQDHCISLGPYTLLTVDEGYAAVTQNNGKQIILPGGHVHLLDHKNWKFEKFMTMKIQTDNLERIQATSADNIVMQVTSTVVWRIANVQMAATLAAETMAASGRTNDVSADISKLRADVLKQAIASLSSFIASVNYSDSFHLAAAAQASASVTEGIPTGLPADGSHRAAAAHDASRDNPMYDAMRMKSAVEQANEVTMRYGISILSINIISANPVDVALTRALASGAVAAAEALQAETAARGKAKALQIAAQAQAQATKIAAQAQAQATKLEAEGDAGAIRLRAAAEKDAATLLESSEVAVDLAKIRASAEGLQSANNTKFFFAEGPEYMKSMLLKEA